MIVVPVAVVDCVTSTRPMTNVECVSTDYECRIKNDSRPITMSNVCELVSNYESVSYDVDLRMSSLAVARSLLKRVKL